MRAEVSPIRQSAMRAEIKTMKPGSPKVGAADGVPVGRRSRRRSHYANRDTGVIGPIGTHSRERT